MNQTDQNTANVLSPLRRWFLPNNKADRNGSFPKVSPSTPSGSPDAKAEVWAVGGGKGGTGKTAITSSLGVGLAVLGYRVVLIDGDLGGANMHLLFGISSPEQNLGDFINGRVSSLQDLVVPTRNPNLSLICGGSEANLSCMRQEKLKRHIRSLDADFVLLDLGAGTGAHTLDLFSMATRGIVVLNAEPQSRIVAYTFLKNALYQQFSQAFGHDAALRDIIFNFGNEGQRALRIQSLITRLRDVSLEYAEEAEEIVRAFRPGLILNKSRKRKHRKEAQRFMHLASEYLSLKMDYLGQVQADQQVVDSYERMRPFLLARPRGKASMDVYRILLGLDLPRRKHMFGPHGFGKRDCKKLSARMKAEAKCWG